ncbi:Hypothetical protein FKW44_021415, partial [Caligus rogercresseyi]
VLNSGVTLALRPAVTAPPTNNRVIQQQQQQQQVVTQQQQQQNVYQAPNQSDVYDIYEEYGSHPPSSSSHYGGSDGGYETHVNLMEQERRLSLQQQNQIENERE